MNEQTCWTDVDGEARPLASRCGACGRSSFPIAEQCRFCGGAVESVALSATGTVEGCSLMVGLMLAHVRTKEGVRLLAQAAPTERIRPGVRVRFAPEEGKMRFVCDE